jgi:hypothetical protein
MNGGYCYRAVRTAKGDTFHEMPAKNQWSHPADALGYLLLGGGEHDTVLNKVRRSRGGGPRIADGVDFNPIGYEPDYAPRRRDPMPGERGYRGSWR